MTSRPWFSRTWPTADGDASTCEPLRNASAAPPSGRWLVPPENAPYASGEPPPNDAPGFGAAPSPIASLLTAPGGGVQLISSALVFDLACIVKPQRRVLVMLAAFSGLRVAELLALRRRHVDVLHRRLIVRESTVERSRGQLVTKSPKSDAGVRKVHLDPMLFEAVQGHLRDFTAPTADAFLFSGDKGGPPRRAVWFREWDEARSALGLSNLHFHDLRHTHGTLVAKAGGTMKETMRRLGHSTIQAAMVYQHATDDRDRELAAAIGERIADELERVQQRTARRAVEG